MKIINFHIKNNSQAFQLIDVLYAYRQSLDDKFQTTVKFRLSSNFDPMADVNVFCDYMPDIIDYEELKKYQLILLTSSCEPLTTSTTAMVECLNKLDNCYLICNSLLTQEHKLYNKVIWFPGEIFECRKLWTDHFYPHALENAISAQQLKNQSMVLINGQNRAHRHYFINELKNHNVGIVVRSSLSDTVCETNDSELYESFEDTEFKEWVNNQYSNLIARNQKYGYYEHSDIVGINGNFGIWPPGYRILKEYFTHRVVVFPESTWQNNEMAITEKSCKCFFAGSLPWPVGGSNLNFLYNQVGFFTAWNLVPEELQKFDSVLDHRKRYQQQVLAIEWLLNNMDVFDLESTKIMIASNQKMLYNNRITLDFVKRFDQLIQKYTA
jgi:hypothetical protein